MPTQPHEEEHKWGDLIIRIAQGDHAAVAELYDSASSLVFSLALRILDDREAAEEVTLDVFTQVWRQAESYDARRGTPASWLLTLARSRTIDRFRASAPERKQSAPLDTLDLMSDECSNPEVETIERERCRLVQQALTALPPEQREPIVLAYFYGLSQSEIAAKLGMPLGTVKTRIRSGMFRLRELLAAIKTG